MREELLVLSSVVKVSEVGEPLVVAPAEGLLSEVEPEKDIVSAIVVPAALGTVIVPKTSVWLCVSRESAEVSFRGLVLTVTKVPSEAGV